MEGEGRSGGRLDGDNPFGGMLFTERNFDVVDVLREVAGEVERTMAEVALAWLVARPAVSSVLIGASRPEQLTQNLASLTVVLSDEHRARLERASALPLLNPYFIFDMPLEALFGGQNVTGWSGR